MVLASLDDDKAEEVVAIDVTGRASFTDRMVIATGRSSRQVSSMAQHLVEKLGPLLGHKPTVEGLSQGDWVLVDLGDVVVHLFRPEVRGFYQLEKMWAGDEDRVALVQPASVLEEPADPEEQAAEA